jgi:hypothetical protein
MHDSSLCLKEKYEFDSGGIPAVSKLFRAKKIQ